MDKGILSAFKNLEKKLENEKKEALRQERLKELQKERELLERKRFQKELLSYAGLFVFFFLIAIGISKVHIVAKSQGRSLTSYVGAKLSGGATGSSSFGGRGSGGGEGEPVCDKPETWRTPACIEKRQKDADSNWKDLSIRTKDGKPTAFTVHGK